MRPAFGIGILLFAAAFAVAAWGVTSIEAPSFAVRVAPESAFADDGEGTWRVEVTPASDRDRLVARLDRSSDLALTPVGSHGLTASLPGLSPGYHFVEAVVRRSGGREDRVVDVVAAGPFQGERERGCDVALALSPEGVRRLLLPAIEHKVVAGAQAQTEFFGATSHITASDLALVDGGLSFTVTVDTTEDGKGDLAVAGVIAVTSVGEGAIALQLVELVHATPGPKLTALAQTEGGKRGSKAGLGGGAVVGGIFGGPGGAALGGLLGGVAGNAIGARLGKHAADVRTQEVVYGALVEGLALATQELTLPRAITLLPTTPALVADLRWCDALNLQPAHGLRAALSLRIRPDTHTQAARAVAVFRGLAPDTIGAVAQGADASVQVGEDLVNRLLAEWTVRGGFDAALTRGGLGTAIQAELGERTRWQIESIAVELPPVVRLEQGSIAASLGGVTLRLRDDARDHTRDVVVGGVGTLRLEVGNGAKARISGALSQAYFGCRLPSADDRVLPACFSAAVDPELIRKKINVAIVVQGVRMPSIDLSDLLRLRLASATGNGMGLASATLMSAPGVLRLDGIFTPEPQAR